MPSYLSAPTDQVSAVTAIYNSLMTLVRAGKAIKYLQEKFHKEKKVNKAPKEHEAISLKDWKASKASATS